MAGADVIAVALLEHFQVADHALLGDVMAGIGPVLMAVGAFEFDGHAVDREDASLDLDLAETGARGNDFALFSAGQRQHGGVKIGRLGRPFGRLGYRDVGGHRLFLARVEGWNI